MKKRTSHHNRSLLNHGPGKGDKDRTEDTATFKVNLAAVKFSGVPAKEDPTFITSGGKSCKVYGSPQTVTVFEKLLGKPIIH